MQIENKKQPLAVCFGEILWDVLPSKTKPGGAPMNVAYHLDRLGVKSMLLSKVGDDPKGRALLQLLKDWKLSDAYCGVDRLRPTSEVIVQLNSNGEAHYEIVAPVAWDFIEWDENILTLVRESDAFVFGSLAARNPVSRQTLFKLINESGYNVFDVNLREPHYSKQTVLSLLEKTNLLKLNSSELDILSSWVLPGVKNQEEKVQSLQGRFNIPEILVTKGNRGVSYYRSSERFDHPAYRVEVLDTIGAGDAFLAAFLAFKFSKEDDPDVQLAYASALGAFVTAHDGACPEYTMSDLNNFILGLEVMMRF